MNGRVWFGLFVALYVGTHLGLHGGALGAVLFVLALGTGVLSLVRGRLDLSLPALALVVLLGFGLAGVHQSRFDHQVLAVMEHSRLMLEVQTVPRQTGYGYRSDASVRGGLSPVRVRLHTRDAYSPGTVLEVPTRRLSIPEPARGRGQPHWQQILKGSHVGLQGFLEPGEFRVAQPASPALRHRLLRRQERFRDRLETVVPDQGPLLTAVLFGDTTGLEEDFLADTGLLGVRHLFAVSGMHAGAFGLLLTGLAVLLGLSGWLRLCLLGGGMGLFCLLTGMTPSALRASSLMLLHGVFRLQEREGSLLAALGITGLWMLLWRPFYVYSVGFGLSFGAVAGLAGIYPVLRRFLPGPAPVLAGFSAWAGALPFQQVFGRSSLLGIGLTAVLAPLLGLLVPAGFLLFLLPPVFWTEPLIRGLGLLSRLFMAPVSGLTETMGLRDWLDTLRVVLPQTGEIRILLYYGFWMVIGLVGCRPEGENEQPPATARWSLGACCVLLVAFLSLPVVPRGLHIHFLDVGQGDAIVIRQNDWVVLVDGGTPAAGRRSVIPWLEAGGIRRIDLMICTHAHNDHLGGLQEVLEAFSVDRVLLGIDAPVEPGYEGFLERLEELDIPVGFLGRGASFRMGSVSFRVLSPDEETTGGPNERSLALGVRKGTLYARLTGDLEGHALHNLEPAPDGAERVLHLVPHHGSRHSLDRPALDRLDAHLAVISCGTNNRYGHPHPEVLDYYEGVRNLPVFRTDRMGELWFHYRGGRLRGQTFLLDEVWMW